MSKYENLLNLTVRDINIYDTDMVTSKNSRRQLVLKDFKTAPPVEVIPTMNTAAVAAFGFEKISNRRVKKKYTFITELPEGYDGYVVSADYAAACRYLGRDVSKLYVPWNPIHESEGSRKIVGYLGLLKV